NRAALPAPARNACRYAALAPALPRRRVRCPVWLSRASNRALRRAKAPPRPARAVPARRAPLKSRHVQRGAVRPEPQGLCRARTPRHVRGLRLAHRRRTSQSDCRWKGRVLRRAWRAGEGALLVADIGVVAAAARHAVPAVARDIEVALCAG